MGSFQLGDLEYEIERLPRQRKRWKRGADESSDVEDDSLYRISLVDYGSEDEAMDEICESNKKYVICNK